MTDAHALIAAIEATPRDNMPRLAWADWLDDHGRPERAELVRLQCARKPVKGTARRVKGLLDALGRDWPPELIPPGYAFDDPDRESLRPKFERGCLIEIGFDAADYLAVADRFAGREPLVDVTLFANDRGVPPGLANSPHLRRAFAVYGRGFGRTFVSPHVHRLRHIHGCSPTEVAVVAATPVAGRVWWLTVGGDSDHDPAALARVLADTPAFANLLMLELHDCRFTAADWRMLMASPHLSPALDLFVFGRGKPRHTSAVVRELQARFPDPAPAPPCD